MITSDIENFAKDVKDVIRDWFKNDGFKDRKLTDTPTDDLQVVNKKYADSLGSSGWSLVSYTTAVTGANFTVSGLNLSTALEYKILVNCRNVTNAGILNAKCNADGVGLHSYATQEVSYDGGATEANVGASASVVWQLGTNVGSMSFHSDLSLGYNNGLPMVSYNTSATGKAADVTVRPVTVNGAGFFNDTNITQIQFLHNSGTDCQWAVWVFKSSQS